MRILTLLLFLGLATPACTSSGDEPGTPSNTEDTSASDTLGETDAGPDENDVPRSNDVDTGVEQPVIGEEGGDDADDGVEDDAALRPDIQKEWQLWGRRIRIAHRRAEERILRVRLRSRLALLQHQKRCLGRSGDRSDAAAHSRRPRQREALGGG